MCISFRTFVVFVFRTSYMFIKVKVGLAMLFFILKPLAIPLTKEVFPAPKSPDNNKISPPFNLAASFFPNNSVSDCEFVIVAIVGHAGLEPTASSSRTTRATNCANARIFAANMFESAAYEGTFLLIKEPDFFV